MVRKCPATHSKQVGLSGASCKVFWPNVIHWIDSEAFTRAAGCDEVCTNNSETDPARNEGNSII
jgi:hypothetical protein